jgi:hypothetical protein
VRRTLRPPAGCGFGGAGAGTVVWNCPADDQGRPAATGRTFDLTTGEETVLRTVRPSEFPDDTSGTAYVGIGRFWAVVRVSGYHFDDRAYVNRRTGELRRVSDSDPTVALDPDRPALLRPLCDPMRRPSELGESTVLELGDLALTSHGRTSAAVTYDDEDGSPRGRVVFGRCGKPTRTIRDCRAIPCSSVVLDDRTLAWVETRRTPRGTSRSRIRIRSLHTGRTRSIERRGTPSLVLDRHRLFAVSGGRLLRISR